MRKRRVRILVMLVALLSLLSALSWAGGQSEVQELPTYVIRYQHSMWTEPSLKAQEQQVKDFMGTNPDIRIELEYVPYAEWPSATMAKFVGGNAPDLLHSVSFDLRYLVPYGAFLDLTPYLQDGSIDKSRIPDYAWEEGNFDGKIVAMPWQIQIDPVMYYRKDMFDEQGISAPSANSAWTWRQATEAAQKLTRDTNGDGTMDQWGWVERAKPGFIFFKGFNWYLWSNGADLIRQDDKGKWKSAFDTEATRQAYRFYCELESKYRVRPADIVGYGFMEALTGFVEKKHAMVSMGFWFTRTGFVSQYPEFAKEYGKKWDVMLLPAGPNKNAANPDFQPAWFHQYSISRQCKHPEQAVKYLSFAVDNPKYLGDICWEDGVVPTLKGAADSRWAESAFFKKVTPWLDKYAIVLPKHPKYAEISNTIVTPLTQEVITGQTGLDDAVKQIDVQINRALGY